MIDSLSRRFALTTLAIAVLGCGSNLSADDKFTFRPVEPRPASQSAQPAPPQQAAPAIPAAPMPYGPPTGGMAPAPYGPPTGGMAPAPYGQPMAGVAPAPYGQPMAGMPPAPYGPAPMGPRGPMPMGPAGPMPMGPRGPMPMGPAGPTARRPMAPPPPPPPPQRRMAPRPRGNNTPFGNNMPFGKNGPTWGGSRTPWSGNSKPWGGKNQSWRPESWFEDRKPIFGKKGPSEWFDKDDYKDGLGDMWDDLLNAPSNAGKMPGGWYAPTINVPNPVDVGDEFENAATDVPNQARDQMENFSFDGRDFKNPGGRPAGAPKKKPAQWGTKATSKK